MISEIPESFDEVPFARIAKNKILSLVDDENCHSFYSELHLLALRNSEVYSN